MGNNNIILIGFMGSGKSTLGRRLARLTGSSFVDTDEMIEQQQGRAIKDIFAQEGEAYFRDLETKALEELLQRDEDGVIAVGGGLPVRSENRALLKKLGLTVYLNASVDTLEERLSGDKKRPLLQGADVRSRIEGLMAEREALYLEAADKTLKTDGYGVRRAVGMLERLWKQTKSAEKA